PDHVLLHQWHIFSWNFNPHVPTWYHQPIRNFDNFFKVVDPFLGFNLWEDQDIFLVLFLEQFTNVQDVLGLPDKGSSDEVDPVIQTKTNVTGVLFRNPWQVNRNARGINPLA